MFKVSLQRQDGYKWTIYRRFSDFSSFQEQVRGLLPEFTGKLPSKELLRPLANLFGVKAPEPSSTFLSERREGLDQYVKDLLKYAKTKTSFWNHPSVLNFFDLTSIVNISDEALNDLQCPVRISEWEIQLQTVSHTLEDAEKSMKRLDTASISIPNEVQLKQIRRQLNTAGNKIEKLQKSLDFYTTKRNSINEEVIHSWSNRFQTVAAKHFALSNNPSLIFPSSPSKTSSSRESVQIPLNKSNEGGNVSSIAHTPLRSPATISRPLSRRQSLTTMMVDPGAIVTEQQKMIHQQDAQLSELSSIIKRHQQLGVAINNELQEHNQLLEKIDSNMTSTQTKLNTANRRVKKI